MRLDGKLAVITGAGSGIGAATARILAAAGAAVVLGDLDDDAAAGVAEEIVAAGDRAEAIRVDVTDPESVESLMEFATSVGNGRIEVVAHCAGIVHVGTILETSQEDFARVVGVNLGGTFTVCRAAIDRMHRTGGGSIIAIGSMASLQGFASFSAYTAAKGGVLLLVKSLALEWAEHGIRINAVCPGVIRTPMQREILAAVRGRAPADDREFDEMLAPQAQTMQAIKRWGTPEEVAYAVLYLASDEAGFVTGTALPIDGGATAG